MLTETRTRNTSPTMILTFPLVFSLIAILGAGLGYAWEKGVLEWK